MENARFNQHKYLIRKKLLRVIGAAFHIYNTEGTLEFYVKQKGFKLKEDIRVFTSEDMTDEVLIIKARNIVDFGATYDVFDTRTNEMVGSLRRKGLKSMFKDEWIILDANNTNIGTIKEDNVGLAMVRRFLTHLIPQGYIGRVDGQEVFRLKQYFNPFILKILLDFSADSNHLLDRRMGIAAGVLLCAIEGRQK